MGLYMENNGYYYIRICQNGQITKLSTKNKSLAQEIYNNFLLSLVNQRSIAKITTSKRNVETKKDVFLQLTLYIKNYIRSIKKT